MTSPDPTGDLDPASPEVRERLVDQIVWHAKRLRFNRHLEGDVYTSLRDMVDALNRHDARQRKASRSPR
jgi:hypothetical protein